MGYCPHCGEENADDAAYCQYCGGEAPGGGSGQHRPQQAPAGRGQARGQARGQPAPRRQAGSGGLSRRQLLGGGGVGVLALTGGWLVYRDEAPPVPDEPGTGFDDAPPIPEGRFGPYWIENGESHYYSVNLKAGDRLRVAMYFEHVRGDLDLEVYGPDESWIDKGISLSDNEDVAVKADEAGTFYIVPYGHARATNSYELEVEVE